MLVYFPNKIRKDQYKFKISSDDMLEGVKKTFTSFLKDKFGKENVSVKAEINLFKLIENYVFSIKMDHVVIEKFEDNIEFCNKLVKEFLNLPVEKIKFSSDCIISNEEFPSNSWQVEHTNGIINLTTSIYWPENFYRRMKGYSTSKTKVNNISCLIHESFAGDFKYRLTVFFKSTEKLFFVYSNEISELKEVVSKLKNTEDFFENDFVKYVLNKKDVVFDF